MTPWSLLCETRDGSLWAGTYGDGLWRLKRRAGHGFTPPPTGSPAIRFVRWSKSADGTLWIGTFGGGLNGLRDGHFFTSPPSEGLLSDNISHVEDDGHGSLWLSTTRGICRVAEAGLERSRVRARSAPSHP